MRTCRPRAVYSSKDIHTRATCWSTCEQTALSDSTSCGTSCSLYLFVYTGAQPISGYVQGEELLHDSWNTAHPPSRPTVNSSFDLTSTHVGCQSTRLHCFGGRDRQPANVCIGVVTSGHHSGNLKDRPIFSILMYTA